MFDQYFQFEFVDEDHKLEIATPVKIRKHGCDTDIEAKAVWDTGATGTMIASSIAKKLNLAAIGTTQISGVHGSQRSKVYRADIVFGNGFAVEKINMAQAADNGGFDVLIGMDVIGKGCFFIDGTKENLKVIFQYPVNMESNKS